MNALVLDDEQRYRDHLKRYLEQRGLRIHVAEQAEEAKRLVEEYGVDLMIVDIKLANSIDGLEFADWAKRQKADTALIVITGYNCPDYEARSRALGAIAYLEKPFSLRELEVHVQRAMDQRNLLREVHRLEQELAAAREADEAQQLLQCIPVVCLDIEGRIRYASPEGRTYLEAVTDPNLTRPLLEVDGELLGHLRTAIQNDQRAGRMPLFRRDGIISHYDTDIRWADMEGGGAIVIFFSEPTRHFHHEMDDLWANILIRAAHTQASRSA